MKAEQPGESDRGPDKMESAVRVPDTLTHTELPTLAAKSLKEAVGEITANYYRNLLTLKKSVRAPQRTIGSQQQQQHCLQHVPNRARIQKGRKKSHTEAEATK